MLADILDQIQEKPDASPLPTGVLDYLHTNRIPCDINSDIEASSYADWIQLGPLSLLPMAQLITQTEGILCCMEHGYLVLAGGRNGDPVAVQRDTKRMVFISHDRLFDEPEDFLECVHETPYLYEEFWDHVVADPEFPCDYYEAKRRWPDQPA